MRRSRRLIERLRMRGQKIQWQRSMDVIGRLPGVHEVGFGGNKDQIAENRPQHVVRGTQAALASVCHAALVIASQTMVMHGAHAGTGSARARLPASGDAYPPQAGREQGENGKNGQKLAKFPHVVG